MFRQLLTSAIVLAIAFSCNADEKTTAHSSHHPSPTSANATMTKLQTLVGTWVAADEKNQPTDQIVSVVKLTAGGSAIHETLFPGQEQEMISIYTLDGDDVVMTHYCMLGNQPQMKAEWNQSADTIKWIFAGGRNLDPAVDKHMHGAIVTFIDDDHIQIEGEAWENGKPSPEMCGTMKLVRKK